MGVFYFGGIMARKHFDEYLNTITKQYRDLQETLSEMTVESESGMIEPERIDQLKATIQPIKNSFDTLIYIKYLLDMPNRKSKQKNYDSANKYIKEYTKSVCMEKVYETNKHVLENLSNCI